ncbi:hypothetical protein ETU08_03465 [Apibacter muscae]|uniref:hypothetical protein n=1 Tax=Apibacter muscae TaxID=2509004 RepID=UPI0011AD9E8F|nr:hypothetical protein [Apibacter muscae]TWP31078.1 hypothetical protein ETU08_03465 [Apibacter muscae]
MKIIKVYISLFIILFFSSCKKINAQKDNSFRYKSELLGEWESKENLNNTFSINFGEIKGDSIFGQYCAVAREGRKIDCDTDEIFNIKGIIKDNIIKISFTSFFNAKNGKAKIIITDSLLRWVITKYPEGESYAPKESTLTKSEKKELNFYSLLNDTPSIILPINYSELDKFQWNENNYKLIENMDLFLRLPNYNDFKIAILLNDNGDDEIYKLITIKNNNIIDSKDIGYAIDNYPESNFRELVQFSIDKNFLITLFFKQLKQNKLILKKIKKYKINNSGKFEEIKE